jgi:hypothetical protein
MKTITITGKIALVALCATALTSVTQKAHALVTFDIVPGASLLSIPGQFPGYGTAISQDNVVNSGTTGQTVADGLSGASWIASTTSPASPAYLTVVGLTGPQTYNVKFSYLGSESNDVIQFTSGAITPFNENNANNNCGGCALPGGLPLSPQTGIAPIGTNSGLTATIVPFTLTDTTTGTGAISNGTANSQPGSGISNLIFSYATFNPAAGLNGVYTLTSSVTDFVVFGFNDNGGADDNHDDFVGVAQLQVLGQGTQGETPIPAALPLFGSVFGGGYLFSKWRRKRKKAAVVAA